MSKSKQSTEGSPIKLFGRESLEQMKAGRIERSSIRGSIESQEEEDEVLK